MGDIARLRAGYARIAFGTESPSAACTNATASRADYEAIPNGDGKNRDVAFRFSTLRSELRTNHVDRRRIAVGRAEASGDAHGVQHRVVDVQTFGADVEDLAGFETAVRA